jgi:hypothetical protein
MPVLKLSQGLLETLNSSGKDKEDFFDATTKGLMVQVRASGRKTYYFRERGEDGKTIQLKRRYSPNRRERIDQAAPRSTSKGRARHIC